MTSFASDPRPIGVFDSGVGGLTVLKALIRDLPGQAFIYLGDTARVPYGTKSAETVRTYSLGLTRILLQHDVKMIVIACNTASAHATESVRAMAAPVPVIGMVEPAVAAVTGKNILLMATQSTVMARSYEAALKARDPSCTVLPAPCQVLVALAEEGWTDGPVAEAALKQYIGAHYAKAQRPDTVILGCTHFPMLRESIERITGPDTVLIDTGEAAARHIAAQFGPFSGSSSGACRFMVTDSVERFRPLAERFLGMRADSLPVEQINL